MTDPMTDRQRGTIFQWGKDLKLDKDELNELSEYLTGKRIAALTVDDARRAVAISGPVGGNIPVRIPRCLGSPCPCRGVFRVQPLVGISRHGILKVRSQRDKVIEFH